jgi:diguanylate cyclase (GGDEF)-like protein
MHPERSTDTHRTLGSGPVELEDVARRDGLTGLYNRAWFDDQLGERWREWGQVGTPLTVMLADIDGLAAINQANGGAAGDRVIVSVAACLKRRVRPTDLVARHSGAVMAVLLTRAPARAARAVAERLRAAVVAETHEALRVTISVGCVTLERGGFVTRVQLLDTATRALDAAKRAGRDRVVSLVDATGDSLDRPPPAV